MNMYLPVDSVDLEIQQINELVTIRNKLTEEQGIAQRTAGRLSNLGVLGLAPHSTFTERETEVNFSETLDLLNQTISRRVDQLLEDYPEHREVIAFVNDIKGISVEGFFSGLLNLIKKKPKSGSTDTGGSDSEVIDWAYKHIETNGNLKKGLVIEDATLNLSGKNASFFFRNGKLVDDIAKELRLDLEEFKTVYSKYKSDITNDIELRSDLIDELSNWKDTGDFNDLRKILLSHKPKLGKIKDLSKVTITNYMFLGDPPVEIKPDSPYANWDGVTKSKAKVTNFIVKKETMSDLLALLQDISDLWLPLHEQVGSASGLDATDYPLRGYFDEIDGDKEVSDFVYKYSYIDEDETSNFIVSVIYNVIEEYRKLIKRIVMASVKKG